MSEQQALPHEAAHILIVEDEEGLRVLLSRSLQRWKYTVATASNGKEALERFDSESVDIVLLDLLLPDMTGFAICRAIRKRSDVPIIMLSALNQVEDVVKGIEAGADDYVTKPFSFSEIQARVQSLLRRVRSTKLMPTSIHEMGMSLDYEEQSVRLQEDLIKLTPTEFKLLEQLLINVGNTVRQEALFIEVWGYVPEGKARLLHTNIRRLRRKLEPDPQKPAMISTIPGVGYRFNLLT